MLKGAHPIPLVYLFLVLGCAPHVQHDNLRRPGRIRRFAACRLTGHSPLPQIDHQIRLLDERVDVELRAPYVPLHKREAWIAEQLPYLVRPQVNGSDGMAFV